ncbi:hypothetical protein [Aquimarina litoralis]|uniref:hypothetical protein n=1 Tax=Aquimarina litoralis TaxID=584605 RepID=UPI001C574C35|nr:hypothetical protein [Aquimarina litoralis]MBW1298527.1 hypothetical protein [Aquimarina litoralis]
MLQNILKHGGVQLSKKEQSQLKAGHWNNICPSEGEPCDNSIASANLIARNCLAPMEPLYCNGSTWQTYW